MKVKLTKDKREGGKIKTTVREGRKEVIGWFEGAVIEVSNETGAKLIKAGEAVEA